MPWKMDEEGNLVMDGSNPVWISADGKEAPYDPEARGKQIAELTAKARQRKDELEAPAEKYEALKDIEDVAEFVAAAKRDAETVAAMQEKDRQTEETIRRRIDEALKPVAAERDKLRGDLEKTIAQLAAEIIGNKFMASPYVNTHLVNPAMAKELFSNRFVMRDGALIAKSLDGSEMYGETGSLAGFEEAIKKMVADSPFRDNLLKQAPGGSGSTSSNGKRPGINPWKQDTLNFTEQARITRENPALAETLAKEAGAHFFG